MIKDLTARPDFDELLARSQSEPVFLLKHSTRCPISAAAWREYQRYASAHPDRELYRVLVIEERTLSGDIAQYTGVAHQSPQALLFSGGEVVWHASRWAITIDALDAAMAGMLDQ